MWKVPCGRWPWKTVFTLKAQLRFLEFSSEYSNWTWNVAKCIWMMWWFICNIWYLDSIYGREHWANLFTSVKALNPCYNTLTVITNPVPSLSLSWIQIQRFFDFFDEFRLFQEKWPTKLLLSKSLKGFLSYLNCIQSRCSLDRLDWSEKIFKGIQCQRTTPVLMNLNGDKLNKAR